MCCTVGKSAKWWLVHEPGTSAGRALIARITPLSQNYNNANGVWKVGRAQSPPVMEWRAPKKNESYPHAGRAPCSRSPHNTAGGNGREVRGRAPRPCSAPGPDAGCEWRLLAGVVPGGLGAKKTRGGAGGRAPPPRRRGRRQRPADDDERQIPLEGAAGSAAVERGRRRSSGRRITSPGAKP